MPLAAKASGPSKAAAAKARQAVVRNRPATLAPLLRHLRGLNVNVELKSGRSYTGILTEADDFMNLILQRGKCERPSAWDGSDAIRWSDRSGRDLGIIPKATRNVKISDTSSDDKKESDILPFDRMHIRGPLIRYVHLPPKADLSRLIKNGLERERAARDKYKRGKRSERKVQT